MTTLFVSDLHLHRSRPEATGCFLRFLSADARQASALYILGDLFEVWIGDDADDPHDLSVMAALRRYTAGGNACRFIRGNRDFLIDGRFAALTGVELLPDEAVVEIMGERVLLMHGDSLCTDDHAYQRYRRIVRQPLAQRLFLALPRATRAGVFTFARGHSAIANARKPDFIMDVNEGAVAVALQRHGLATMVHGHTHRPALHRFQTGGMDRLRIVLGDWYSRGSVLRWSDRGPELSELRFA